MTVEDIIVIGAGPAGLAVSACLRQEGLPHTVLERAPCVASSWRQHYDRLHLHTVKRYSALPFSPWPREAPQYPSRDEVIRYLEAYAAQHRVAPRCRIEVRRVKRHGARFTVETSEGRLQPRTVIVATGYNGVANRPAIPGLNEFAGTVVHTQAYRNPLPYADTRTLVVGCGNSGAEIALDLAEHNIDVSMVVRGPVHVVPRDLFGRPSQQTGVRLSRLPVAWRDALALPLLRLAVGNLSRWGIVRPPIGPNRLIEEAGRMPILDVGTIAMVKAGRIRVVPAVQAIQGERVLFVDGRLEPFDAIILATGYTPGLHHLIEDFHTIADQRGRPRHFGGEADVPGLFFVGFRNPPTGAPARDRHRSAPCRRGRSCPRVVRTSTPYANTESLRRWRICRPRLYLAQEPGGGRCMVALQADALEERLQDLRVWHGRTAGRHGERAGCVPGGLQEVAAGTGRGHAGSAHGGILSGASSQRARDLVVAPDGGVWTPRLPDRVARGRHTLPSRHVGGGPGRGRGGAARRGSWRDVLLRIGTHHRTRPRS